MRTKAASIADLTAGPIRMSTENAAEVKMSEDSRANQKPFRPIRERLEAYDVWTNHKMSGPIVDHCWTNQRASLSMRRNRESILTFHPRGVVALACDLCDFVVLAFCSRRAR